MTVLRSPRAAVGTGVQRDGRSRADIQCLVLPCGMTLLSPRVGWRFALGGLLGLLVIFLFESRAVALARQLLPPVGWLDAAVNLFVPAAGFFLSGALGGAALGHGKRATIGFGLAFMLTSPIWVLTIIGIQAMGTNQSLFGELALGFILGFGVAGAIGSAFLGRGIRMIIAGGAVFGLAAIAGAAVVALPFTLMGGGINYGGVGRPAGPWILRAAMLLGPLLTYFLGGALLGAQVERRQARS